MDLPGEHDKAQGELTNGPRLWLPAGLLPSGAWALFGSC